MSKMYDFTKFAKDAAEAFTLQTIQTKLGERYWINKNGRAAWGPYKTLREAEVVLQELNERIGHSEDMATDPPVSTAQRKAMGAAASGNSNLGIPKSVGKEFIEADPGGKLPAKKR